MKERLVSLGLAAASLALFWALFVPKPTSVQPAVARPLATDSGEAGYLGLVRWLDAEHVPVVVWHRRFDRLLTPASLPSEAGNVLITTMPHARPVRSDEQVALDTWLARGNTLVVLAGLDDTPKWTLAASDGFVEELQRITRITFATIDEPSGDDVTAARAAVRAVLTTPQIPLTPLGSHPLLAGVGAIATRSDLPASRWGATPMDLAPLLVLARRSDTGDPAIWLKGQGSGRVLICAFAGPWSNGLLGEADNARWLSSVLGVALDAQGRVLLDDAHQGVTDEYDSAAFLRDGRLHRTIGWLLALWLVFVVGAQPLRAAWPGPRPLDDTALLAASAGFFANALSAPVAGARLLEHFFNAIRRRLGLRQNGAPVWEWLDAQRRLSADEIAELRRLHARIEAGGKISLTKLNVLLTDLTRKCT